MDSYSVHVFISLPLEDCSSLVAYILAGLDADFNPFVESICRQESITLSDFYAQVLSSEARIDAQKREAQQHNYININVVACGRDSGDRCGGVRAVMKVVVATRLAATEMAVPK